jgi:hypothetical protein
LLFLFCTAATVKLPEHDAGCSLPVSFCRIHLCVFCFRHSSWVIAVCALLFAHCGAQFAPLVGSSESECALLLEGPGRTSAFDYNLNALRGTL